MDLPFPNPKQPENESNTIQPPRPTIYVEVNNTSSKTELTYNIQRPHYTITSNKLTFIKQIIHHPKPNLLTTYRDPTTLSHRTSSPSLNKLYIIQNRTYLQHTETPLHYHIEQAHLH